MYPNGRERRSGEDDSHGLAQRALRERTPLNELKLREKADRGHEKVLLAGAQEELLAIAGFTREKAAAELTPVEPQQCVEQNPEEEGWLERTPVRQKWFDAFKGRFHALSQLHQGVEWDDVEKFLIAHPEVMKKLKILDDAGFEMNVFPSKNNGEIQFRAAQTNVAKIAMQYKNIIYDQRAEMFTSHPANGNAVDIAASLGVELADQKLYKQFPLEHGRVWLKTHDDVRATGYALTGGSDDYTPCWEENASAHVIDCSFCPVLRVKKA